MKKFIILTLTLITMSTSALAYNYPPEFKKMFYDSYCIQLFGTLSYALQIYGFKPEYNEKYISTLKSRLNRKELEDATWSCISKNTPEQFKKNSDAIIEKCTGEWRNNFIEKNKDILYSLTK